MTEKECNILVSENLNYVKAVANQFRGKGMEFDDLVSEGTLAMITAAQKFDASRGTRFVSYAAPFIRKAMQGLLISSRHFIRYRKIRRSMHLAMPARLCPSTSQ